MTVSGKIIHGLPFVIIHNLFPVCSDFFMDLYIALFVEIKEKDILTQTL